MTDTPKAECTNSDTWNCKYCRKTQTCEALNDPRNFGGTVKPEPDDTTDYRCPYAKALYEEFEKVGQFDTEEFGFAQELVSQYGGNYVDDDAEVFQITAKHLYVIMKVLGYGRLSEKQDKPERRLTGEMIYKALRDSGLTRYHQPDSVIQGDYEKCLERFAHSIFNLN